jgi:hypothetical protein
MKSSIDKDDQLTIWLFYNIDTDISNKFKNLKRILKLELLELCINRVGA